MTRRMMSWCVLLLVTFVANAGAADLTGRWKVTIRLNGETMTGIALLKQNGDAITGSVGVDERNQHPLDGVVKESTITLTTHPRPGRTVAFAKCYLTAAGEKLTGTTEGGDLREKATIEFERTKD